MNYLKQFLTDLTEDGRYFAEMVDDCAEIYINGEARPVVLLEFDDNVYHLNFRCDLTSHLVAQITYDMTIIDEDLVIGKDFFSSSEAGIVYGEEALGLYFASIIQAIESAQMKEEMALNESIYVVKQPIMAFGSKIEQKNKLEKMWDEYGD